LLPKGTLMEESPMARKDDVPIDPVTGGPAERANRLTYYAALTFI
jgi:hypothetical protein